MNHDPVVHRIAVMGSADGRAMARQELERVGEREGHVLELHDGPGALHPIELLSDTELRTWSLIIMGKGATDREMKLVAEVAGACVRHGVPVYYLFDERDATFDAQAPAVLHRRNGVAFGRTRSFERAITTLVHTIGFDERTRRVFISYARIDGTPWADAVRRILQDQGWEVFYDVVDIPPAADFQDELMRDLDGRSMLLLIETPGILQSTWVERELGFARARAIGVMSVLPGGVEVTRSIDADRRYVFQPPLTNPATMDETHIAELTRMAQYIQTESQRARRRSLLESIEDILTSAGYRHRYVAEETIIADHPRRRRTIIRAVPTAPGPADLYALNVMRGGRLRRAGTEGWIVHPMLRLDTERRSLLNWLTKKRPLHVCSIMDFDREFQ